MSFHYSLISFSIVSSRFIHVVLEFPSFVRFSNILLRVYTIFCPSLHLLMDTWVASTFWLLCCTHAARNMGVQIPPQDHASSSLRYIQNETSRSHSNSISNFVRNLYVVKHSNCTIMFPLIIHKVIISLHPCQYKFSGIFLIIIGILISVRGSCSPNFKQLCISYN